MTIDPSLVALLLYIGGALLVFLIFRELVCWYWKQNEIVDLLKEIRDRLPKKPE